MNGRSGSQITEDDEDAYLDEENHTAVPRSDYGRSESNETLDSKDTNSSSREDVFAEDGFETYSDEENVPKHDINDFLKRRSNLRKPVARRRSRLLTHPQLQNKVYVQRTASALSSEDDLAGQNSQP